ATRLNRLGEPDDAARTYNTGTLAEKWLPGFTLQHSDEQSCIDQVKGRVRKLERLCDIHKTEGRIGQALRARTSVGIPNHDLADIDTGHLALRMGKGRIEHPSPRTTTEIENLRLGR